MLAATYHAGSLPENRSVVFSRQLQRIGTEIRKLNVIINR